MVAWQKIVRQPAAPARRRGRAPTLHGPLPSRGSNAAGAVILVMVVNAVYAALLIGNNQLIVAALFRGQRLLRLCRAGVVVNAVALMLMLVPLLNLLLASHPPLGHRAAIQIQIG